jgi:hypothetical protein
MPNLRPSVAAEWHITPNISAELAQRAIMNGRGKPFSAADARKVAMVAFVSQKLLRTADGCLPTNTDPAALSQTEIHFILRSNTQTAFVQPSAAIPMAHTGDQPAAAFGVTERLLHSHTM